MGFSDLELVERWEAQREIKNFMGKYVNSLLLGREAKMFDKFWSDREDVSLGTNSGAYVGPEAIKGYYKAQHGKDALIASILKKRFAERLEGKTETELHGIGTFKAKPLVCPIIEVAGDGLAAKGLWLCQGAYADVYSYGPSSNWTWGHISADFVKEGDGFRLWHLECLDDVDCRCGTTWTSDTSGTSGSSWSSWTSWTSQTSQASWTYSDKLPDLPEFKELAKFELPEPNVKAQARSLYTPKRPLPPPPKFPEPYAFSDEAANSFSSGDSDSVLIRRVWDVESIKTLMHKRSCLIAGDRRREILESLWVSGEEARRTASYGGNWGWHVGFPAIWDHWVLEHEAWLEEQRVRNGFDSVNVGNMYAQPVSTGLVELAGDGKTAKGMWYSIGQETLALPDGKAEARWILAKIAVDFLKEPDGWKIWHLVVSTDLHCLAGEDYSAQPVYVDWDSDPLRLAFGKPTIEAALHDPTFNWWDNYPPMPQPYWSFSDELSYGPEGWKKPAGISLKAGEGRGYK